MSEAATGGSRFSRRSVITGAAGAAVATSLVLGGGRAEAGVPTGAWGHGGAATLRGADVVVKLGRTRQGKFGLMFPNLKPYTPPESALTRLAATMVDRRPPAPDPSAARDGFDNFAVPSGYTFLGQFIDHDITLDHTPLEQATADPQGIRNFESPALDLGSVYGRGPTADPHLYDTARRPAGFLKVDIRDGVEDLPRDASGKAVVGDARNDENLIIAQLHAAFLCLHNTLMESGMSFAAARQQVTWRYQWLVVNDYLPRMCGADVVQSMLERPKTGLGLRFKNSLYKPQNLTKPMMPLEFAVAAYRFGHTMIRPEYELHDNHTKPIFGAEGYDLRGRRSVQREDRIDWSYFFDIPGMSVPEGRNFARLVDAKLSLPLATLPATVVGDSPVAALAERNLLRSVRLGLPGGKAVATAMRLTPLTDQQLGVNDPKLGGDVPLWYYVLREAEVLKGSRVLGPVGARIVAECILGFIALDPTSYFSSGFTREPGYGMGAFLVEAGVVQLDERMAPDPEVPDLPEEPELPEDPGLPEAPDAQEPPT
ncbi:peroxidase family protein [Nakamurella deserti]|uniref:peroxidase family protein n=1 Tax=Nakamurella deserti TaxID=2164074 RepID=UPI00197BEF56|nr:heme peroxidase family protein [Nakamurella deserti]